MEYMFDFTRNTIVRNTAPQAFASYFSVPGTFNPPVDLAYMKLDLATSGTSFTLNMDNAVSPKKNKSCVGILFGQSVISITMHQLPQ